MVYGQNQWQKPLLSPLLLENSNTRKDDNLLLTESLKDRSVNDFLKGTLVTPRKSTEIKAQVAKFQTFQTDNPSTQRLLFRKIIKGFEEQESVFSRS